MKKRNTNVIYVTVAILLSIFMTAVEGTIVSTAMPTIIGSLHGMSSMNWVFAIYLLASAMVTPLYGKLSDILGRKPMFLFGTFIFVIGSSLCALSQTMLELIIFRALQGIGAGALMPVALTIMADIYPVEKRAKVLGYTNAIWGIASIIGPVLGGFIVSRLSWHWIFLINLPIGLLLMAIIFLYLSEPKRHKEKQMEIDITGSICLMGVLLTFLFGIQNMGSVKSRPIGYICFILFLIFLTLFIYIERKVKEPIVSPKIFKNGGFVVINIIIMLCSGFLIGINAYFPMWMQGVLGYSATISGMTLIPLSLTWAIGSHFSGKLLVKITAKRILQIGLLIMAFGGLSLFICQLNTPFYVFLIISAVFGIGFGIVFTTTTVTVQQLVPSDMIGVATSFYTLAQTIGQTIMVTVFGLILNMHIDREILKYAKQGITKDLMNQLICSSEAKNISNEITAILKEILYCGIHNVYTAALVLIIAAMLVNWFNHNRKLDV